jgi:hypothetical protein
MSALLLLPTSSAFANYTFLGWISWYNGVGQVGSDGKVLGLYDCATKIGFDEPPKGTKIYATNLDNETRTLAILKMRNILVIN